MTRHPPPLNLYQSLNGMSAQQPTTSLDDTPHMTSPPAVVSPYVFRGFAMPIPRAMARQHSEEHGLLSPTQMSVTSKSSITSMLHAIQARREANEAVLAQLDPELLQNVPRVDNADDVYGMVERLGSPRRVTLPTSSPFLPTAHQQQRNAVLKHQMDSRSLAASQNHINAWDPVSHKSQQHVRDVIGHAADHVRPPQDAGPPGLPPLPHKSSFV